MPALLKQLNKVYFWDVDSEKLDEVRSKKLIIERVLNFGNTHEIQLLIRHYGESEIIKTICNFNYIDRKTLNFLSLLFNIPKTRFKCYTENPLNDQPWNC